MRKLHLSAIFITMAILSCSELPVNQQIDDTHKVVEEVELITGAESAGITVNKHSHAMFHIEITDIDPDLEWIADDYTGWCIDWKKPIDSNGGQYAGLKLWSTNLVESWKPINFLVNQLDSLYEQDSELSYMEIQLAIWSLRGNPKFDLSKVVLSDLPGRFQRNGNPLFNKQKVQEILDYVDKNYMDFNFSENSKHAIIIETPVDVQTIIAIVN
jgi:hypothetical protein